VQWQLLVVDVQFGSQRAEPELQFQWCQPAEQQQPVQRFCGSAGPEISETILSFLDDHV
jgi:hypothetical protein